LDRWITREPDWADEEGEGICQECGTAYEGESAWPEGHYCPDCAAKIAEAEVEAEVERLVDEAGIALDLRRGACGVEVAA
jgi:hypothetical protein